MWDKSEGRVDIMTEEGIEAFIPYGREVAAILRKTGALERVVEWLSRKSPQYVLVLGASGAGKSSFIKHLLGEGTQISRHNRTVSFHDVDGMIENIRFLITDTPGQMDEVYKDERMKAILTAARQDKLGIINVVSYGLHEETVPKDKAVVDASANASYLQSRRDLEISLLSQWTNVLCGDGGAAAWVMTVVTKADLWWTGHADQEVLKYYQEGPYFQALGPAARLRHRFCPHSSHNQLFYHTVPLSGYYDDKLKQTHRDEFVAALLENVSL